MIKTKTIEYTICDYCLAENYIEIPSVGKTMPSEKDACEKHYKAYTKEIRTLEGEMSGQFIAVDPDYDAKMVIEYKKEK